jgi:hypothetical protein
MVVDVNKLMVSTSNESADNECKDETMMVVEGTDPSAPSVEMTDKAGTGQDGARATGRPKVVTASMTFAADDEEDESHKKAFQMTELIEPATRSVDPKDWPLKDIAEPHPNDVLYGRGGGKSCDSILLQEAVSNVPLFNVIRNESSSGKQTISEDGGRPKD